MKTSIISVLLLLLTPALFCQQSEQQSQAAEIMRQMFLHGAERETASAGYAGTRRYRLENERLDKSAELVAAVHCDADGTKHFAVVSEAGWGSANRHVLRKMLESESETSSPGTRPKSRLTPDNYDFRMVGTEMLDGRTAYVIDVVPKRRDKYLMEGRIWVDATDYALARAEGKPAHNPSFWTKSVHFVQRYQKNGEFWFPVSTDSITEARIFGTTHVNIVYSGYVPNTNNPSPQEILPSQTEVTYDMH
jgi:hypothetical protein